MLQHLRKVLISGLLLVSLCVLGGTPSAAGSDDWDPSTLRPGDVLSIEVFRVSEFSRTTRIENDGTFTYPLCGVIQAAGLTPRLIAREMEKRLAMQIANPQVEVSVSEWSPRRVYVLGEVKNSASLELPTYGQMTVLQAISESGGVTESADLDKVVVLRRVKRGGVSHLQEFKIDVSILASYGGGVVEDFRLRPEDTLVVPKALPVFVTGEIEPSVLYIDTHRPPLLSELVIRCGGLKNGADASRIVIVRKDASGKPELLNASLRQTEGGSVYERDMRILPGDYVMVSSADQIYVLGQVQKPGPLILPPNKVVTASQAIALSGGFTKMARDSKVSLFRGKQMKVIDLHDLYDKVENFDRDIELKDGDILFVPESFW